MYLYVTYYNLKIRNIYSWNLEKKASLQIIGYSKLMLTIYPIRLLKPFHGR